MKNKMGRGLNIFSPYVLLAFIVLIAGTVRAQHTRAYGHGGSVIVTADTTNIDKTNQYLYYYSTDGNWYVSGGGILKQVTLSSTATGTITATVAQFDTIEGLTSDSVFVNDDMVFLQDILFKGTSSNIMSWLDADADVVITIDPNLSDNPTIVLTDSSAADSVKFYHNGTDFRIDGDAGTTGIRLGKSIYLDSGLSYWGYQSGGTPYKLGTVGSSIEYGGTTNPTTYFSVGASTAIYFRQGASVYPFVLATSANIGFGTNDPDHAISISNSSPIFSIWDSDININSSTAAQQIDTNSVWIDASVTEPQIHIKQSLGYSQRIAYALEGWVTHDNDTVTIGVLPANAIVLNVNLWTQEAFDADGTDEVCVGYSGTAEAYAVDVDVSDTGVETWSVGSVAKTVDGTSRTVQVYYHTSDATNLANGECHVIVEWYQATVNP